MKPPSRARKGRRIGINIYKPKSYRRHLYKCYLVSVKYLGPKDLSQDTLLEGK